jgi:hypothetical protein
MAVLDRTCRTIFEIELSFKGPTPPWRRMWLKANSQLIALNVTSHAAIKISSKNAPDGDSRLQVWVAFPTLLREEAWFRAVNRAVVIVLPLNNQRATSRKHLSQYGRI